MRPLKSFLNYIKMLRFDTPELIHEDPFPGKHKRKDLKEGCWYKNPLMESKGSIPAVYTKIYKIFPDIHHSCNSIIFDEVILRDGTHVKESLTQSNGFYEEQMVEVKEEEIEKAKRNFKFGL